jgi:hypothetical protein
LMRMTAPSMAGGAAEPLLDEPASSLLSTDTQRGTSRRGEHYALLMHMGDYHMMINGFSEHLPSSVYQAFPPHLLVRAFHVKRLLNGLGAMRCPPFLCHPLVTAKSIGAPPASACAASRCRALPACMQGFSGCAWSSQDYCHGNTDARSGIRGHGPPTSSRAGSLRMIVSFVHKRACMCV